MLSASAEIQRTFTMINDKIHAGHRARMRGKFARNPVDSFESYELLEMLLYHVIPYKNTHPVSKNLLFRFGDINGVFTAEKQELMAVEGVGEAVADFILSVGRFISTSTVEEQRVIIDEYVKAGTVISRHLLKGAEKRGVAMLMLDNDMGFIGVKTVCDADFESAAVKSKLFLDCAVQHGASVVIIGHVHPYGPLFPTYGDVATNSMVRDALESAGVHLVEHFIVTNEGFVGIMANLNAAFKQTVALKKFLMTKEAAENGGITLF